MDACEASIDFVNHQYWQHMTEIYIGYLLSIQSLFAIVLGIRDAWLEVYQ